MPEMQCVLGMRLPDALALAEKEGIQVSVTTTTAPRRAQTDVQGTLRGIRGKGNEWTVSTFMDETPKE